MISPGVFLCFFCFFLNFCKYWDTYIFCWPTSSFFNKKLFFKFINKCQTEILGCAPPSSHGWDFSTKLQVSGICFPVNFEKFLKTAFLKNTSGRLLLVLIALNKENETEIEMPAESSNNYKVPWFDCNISAELVKYDRSSKCRL